MIKDRFLLHLAVLQNLNLFLKADMAQVKLFIDSSVDQMMVTECCH